MRILLVHSFYSSAQISGENNVVEQQFAALTRAGFEVAMCAQRTDERRRPSESLYRAEVAWTTATGFGRSPRAMIEEWRPDVVHVHNLFPNFGRRWASTIHAPIVATTHNFRVLCAAATLFRDGRVCFDCPEQGSSAPAVKHKCYRGTRLATLPAASGVRFARDPLMLAANRIVVLSERMREIYERFHVPSTKLRVIPNFLPAETAVRLTDDSVAADHWLYVGRLSPEKGVDRLIAEWPAGHRLIVVGDGPLRDALEAAAAPSVTFLGNIDAGSVTRLMSEARGLVFPSRWFEGLPLVYLESLAAGTPVLAWRPSVVADLVESDGTGRVVAGSLASAVELAARQFPGMRERCREVLRAKYSERTWVQATTSVYEDAIADFRIEADS